jgi:gliding motility-associated-like protein
MSFTPPGTYQLCGLSYLQEALGDVQALVGTSLAAAQASLGSSTAPFCADFSDNCITVTIGPAIPPTIVDTMVCLGDCITFAGQTLCNSGSVTLQSWLGCDSVVNVIMIPIPPIFTQQTISLCTGECITVNGQTYCPPGPHVYTVPNYQGCDSTVSLIINEIPIKAIISPANPPPLSCSNPAVTLSSAGSLPAPGPNASYTWTGPGLNSTAPVISVSTAGVYTLTVSNNSISPPCVATASVTVGGNLNGPELQLNSPPPSICEGGSFDLSTLSIVDLNNTNPLITFHSGTPATTANQLSGTVVMPAATTTYYILGTAGVCFDEIPVTVTVNPIPQANFTVSPLICVDSTVTVTYTGNASPNAVFNWNFGGGTANPGTGPGPHTVSWSSGGAKTITLVVSDNNCSSTPISQTVQVSTPIPDPLVNCQPESNAITFTWNSIPEASGYSVSTILGPQGSLLNDTTWVVTGLNPGTQVSILVTAISANACPGSSTQITCTAQNCPPVTLSIDPVPDICLYASVSPVQLTATQSGGSQDGVFTWSGPGMNPITGVFNPANANLGPNTIVLTFEDGTCLYNTSRIINVYQQPTAGFSATSPVCETNAAVVNYTGNASGNANYAWDFSGGTANPTTGPGPLSVTWPMAGNYLISLQVEENNCISETDTQTVVVEGLLPEPAISCLETTSSITFSWDDIPGAAGYEVVVISGETGTAIADTSLFFGGLNPGHAITVQITALNAGICGNSSTQATCIAQDCPPVSIQIDSVPGICLDAAAIPFDLSASIIGASSGGVLAWSGNGITDTLAGSFDPVLAGVGNHPITAVYQEGNCTFSQSITIPVWPQPLASFTATSPVCVGEESTVTYNGTIQAGILFNWNFGAGTTSPGIGQGPHQVSWADAGDQSLSLSVTNSFGCISETSTDTVQVAAPLVAPVISCSATTTSVQFSWPTVQGASDYEVTVLSGPSGNQPNPNTYVVGNLNTGDEVAILLTVSGNGPCPAVTAQSSCTAQDCPPVTLAIAPAPNFCLGVAVPYLLSVNVSGSTGTGSGTWSGPGVIDGANGVFDPVAAGIGQHLISYTYQENNCSYQNTVTIQVSAVPEAEFTMDASVCTTETATVTYTGNAAASATYSWNFGGGTAVPGTGPGPHQVSWPAAGNYQVSLGVVQSGCTSDFFTQNIQVDAPLQSPVISCTTTTTSVQFNWNPVPGASGYAVDILSGQSGSSPSNTSYLLSGLSPGEQVILELTVNSNSACPPLVLLQTCAAVDCPPVTVDIAPVNPICLTPLSQPVNLQASLTGQGSGGSGSWSGPGIANVANGIFNPVLAGIGNHAVTFTYLENNCSFEDATIITVVGPPAADAGANATLTCKPGEETAQLGGSGSATGPNITYNWSAASGAFPGDSTLLSPTVAVPGTYTLTVTNAALGCSSSDVVVITASQDIPQPEISIRPVSCFGSADGSVSVVSVSGGVEPYLYSLNGSGFSSLATFQPLEPGTYELAVMDAAGCENTISIDIQQPQELIVDLVAYLGAEGVVLLGDSVQLEAVFNTSAGNIDFIDWEPDSLLSCDGCPDPFAYPVQATTFTVYIESNGCPASNQQTIYVKKVRPIYVPNAFSPNDDGINDIFFINAGKQVSRINSFLIFDRWGETVYQYYNIPPNDPTYGWDGRHRGMRANIGVYTWFAEVLFTDGTVEIIEGDVMLVAK